MATNSCSEKLDPTFPTEIERAIFELAAWSDPRAIPRLILVAKRVAIWIEPLLYKTLSVTEPQRIGETKRLRIMGRRAVDMLDGKPASFLREHVRHIALTSVFLPVVEAVLLKCTRAVNLALFQDDDSHQTSALLPRLAAMPLQRLSCDLESLFYGWGMDFTHPMFAQLTHLDFLSVPTNWESCTTGVGVGQLPRLTHLSFGLSVRCGEAAHLRFRAFLANCELLEALVLVTKDGDRLRGYEYFADDPRAVVMFMLQNLLEDWEIGADGGEDHWVRADRFINGGMGGCQHQIML
ncbi:hypothetical protein C8R43DRAFT_125042 [Mycena crocata]|nr:hypothetical protein C8R43DRAFT_125042 [Mycena crocata]